MDTATRYTVGTYRSLRIGMVLLLVALAVAVLEEHFHTAPHCFQTSISAYYYTPAQAIFVAVLAAIGVCLIALKGSTSWETVLLNNAGILAPIVAFVPTPSVGACFSSSRSTAPIAANVANNIPAVFAAGVLALLATVVLGGHDPEPAPGIGRVPTMVGVGIGVVELGGAFGWFFLDRSSFIGHAHDTAAIALFGWIVLVALVNAYGFGRGRTGSERVAVVFRNRYSVIAVLMLLIPVVFGVISRITPWPLCVLWTETVMLTLFAVFWLLQTQELWESGIRPSEAKLVGGTPLP